MIQTVLQLNKGPHCDLLGAAADGLHGERGAVARLIWVEVSSLAVGTAMLLKIVVVWPGQGEGR